MLYQGPMSSVLFSSAPVYGSAVLLWRSSRQEIDTCLAHCLRRHIAAASGAALSEEEERLVARLRRLFQLEPPN